MEVPFPPTALPAEVLKKELLQRPVLVRAKFSIFRSTSRIVRETVQDIYYCLICDMIYMHLNIAWQPG